MGDDPARVAFPARFAELEGRQIQERRRAAEVPAGAPVVGLALSGGGIRSATFSLGLLQALAKARLLRRIDYLSTVSGGGYIGSFLGAAFAREEAAGVEAKPDTTRAAAVEDALSSLSGRLVSWLRENGRYLSPNGAGDVLLAAAVMFRNWVAVQLVLATLIVAVFVAIQLVRALTAVFLRGPTSGFEVNGAVALHVWWSPLFLLPLATLVLWAIPAGWAYWLIPTREPGAKLTLREFLPLGTAVILLLVELWAWNGSYQASVEPLRTLQLSAIVTTFVAVTFLVIAWRVGNQRSARMQHDLSVWLKSGLTVTAALGALALVDSLGQTLYVAARTPGAFSRWLLGIPVTLGTLAMVGQKLIALVGAGGRDRRTPLPWAALALVLSLLLGGVMLVSLSAVSHAIAWRAGGPPEALAIALFPPASGCEVSLAADGHLVVSAPECSAAMPPSRAARNMDGLALAIAFGVLALLSLSFGHTRSFLNQSAMAPLYAARLRRAYLGASNPERARSPERDNVTRDVDGDEIPLQQYRPWLHGGPLHLVNVTLNETVSGQSHTEQRDRRGLPMAFGSAGVSVGVRHHAAWLESGSFAKGLEPASEPQLLQGTPRFLVFDPAASPPFCGERLDVSRLVAISGAAVSTGLGSRTSLGVSLLLGMLNVRLGHWWRSGVDPRGRLGADIYSRKRIWGSLGQLFSRNFATQAHLLDEFFARFHGPARRNWNLSDGGHFDNTGCYELIRRRIPLILVADDGADPDYAFGDFAQLVRKARLDFGATVRCASEAELSAIEGTVRGFFGNFEQVCGARGAETAGPHWSRAHAALVIVDYPDSGERSLVIWIKPSLLGSEPADVLHYAREHPAFPQEGTGDQYFDEAQWESYRRLGEHIGAGIFPASGDAGGAVGWEPRSLDPSLWKPPSHGAIVRDT